MYFVVSVKKTFCPIRSFFLVEPARYTRYRWSRRFFFNFRDSLVRQLKEAPNYVKFCGFPLAMSLWFYEYCKKVDEGIVVR